MIESPAGADELELLKEAFKKLVVNTKYDWHDGAVPATVMFTKAVSLQPLALTIINLTVYVAAEV